MGGVTTCALLLSSNLASQTDWVHLGGVLVRVKKRTPSLYKYINILGCASLKVGSPGIAFFLHTMLTLERLYSCTNEQFANAVQMSCYLLHLFARKINEVNLAL